MIARRNFLGVIALTIASISTIAMAHHSTREYDLTKFRRITGVVKEWHFVNPHSQLVLIRDDNRKIMRLEGGAPALLFRMRRMHPTSIAVGERIAVEYTTRLDGRVTPAVNYDAFFGAITNSQGQTFGQRQVKDEPK